MLDQAQTTQEWRQGVRGKTGYLPELCHRP